MAPRWLIMMAVCMPLWATGAVPGADPLTEKRAAALSEQLRCLVCQNQSLAESNAPLAVDLKLQVREKIAQGLSDEDIVSDMVARYGDFVLYRPPVKAQTWLLWFGPALLLALGLGALAHAVRRQGKTTVANPNAEHSLPSEEAVRRAAILLEETNETGGRSS